MLHSGLSVFMSSFQISPEDGHFMLLIELSLRKLGKALTFKHTALFQTFNFQLKKMPVCNYKSNSQVALFLFEFDGQQTCVSE